MSALSPAPPLSGPAQERARRARLRLTDLRASRTLTVLAWIGAAVIVITMGSVGFQVIRGASEAIGRFGPLFAFHAAWIPNLNKLGGLSYLYGSLVTSLVSLVFATILGVSIGIFLALLAPRPVANVIGPLVEMLAAIPTVVLGLIGIIVISPFSAHTLEPLFHGVLGWTGLFGAPAQNGASLFTASLVLTIMVLPIISALSRDIFRTVPQELRDGAEALGATRWEMIRGVVLPTTVSGITGACVLGFARAMGEAIAVTQVVGNASLIHANLFFPGTTLASAIANQFESPQNSLTESALYYLALILLIVGVLTSIVSRRIISRGAKLT
ncbi:phosphate ABC transporter permease subunit PstC [Conexibacter sp. DBS9H8]|uniref:phosphate ABC transporter permease subunit PstC n=1 Tax=Conexibacter sp. DBS9H8 TaxID=2937801 RepID=UPI00200CC1BA|nr:phosphate ABC transporter permease subunit PstC [Conexibacter sp. DBS9H8]